MTGALPTDSRTPAAAPAAVELPSRRVTGTRPWSAIVCGTPDDGTLLIVDWLLLACRAAGFVAHAVPLVGNDRAPYGMYVEVAADPAGEAELSGTPWGAVDLVVAGEHLELARAIAAGYVTAEATTVIASCRRSFTQFERTVAPQHVLAEREIDDLAKASARAYHAFDGPEVARWYGLPSSAQAGLLFGAVLGSGVTALDEAACVAAIARLGIDAPLHAEALRRGTRLGRRTGGRIRRTRTAYQFTRKRRALVDHESRRAFEELVGRCDELVHADHVPALQDAIFLLCQFQDAEWATRLVDHVADIARQERVALGRDPQPEESVVPDAIRALGAMLVWPDAAWVANRKRRAGRLKELRAAHGIGRRDAYELFEYIPMDAADRADARAPGTSRFSTSVDPSVPSLLQPVRVERIEMTSLGGALRLRRLAGAARWRAGTARQRREVDTAETWLEALHDAMRADHGLARIVARSGTMVQGSGAVRDANREAAHAFWGRIVRQSLALDRSATGASAGEPSVSKLIVPFVWEQLCRSGPLALWEYATPVVAIAMAHSRGMAYDEVVAHAEALCRPRRPGRTA